MKISPSGPRLVVTLFIISSAVLPVRVFAQSFPPPDSMKDFSDTMIETPNTAMAFDASDVPFVQPQMDYAGTPVTVQPQQPNTPPTNYDGPIGVTGVIDNVTTGCSYSPLSHNALQGPITDIDVPGALGKYGLKMRRYYNSRSSQYWDASIDLSPGWFHEYSWLLWCAGYKVVSAQGNVSDFRCGAAVGVSEGWDDGVQAQHANGGIWRLADGGRVHFDSNLRADYIDDPYGLRTTIVRDGSNRVWKVTEPGGRYLQFTYGTTNAYIDPAYLNQLLQKVEAYDGQGNLIEKVTYTYSNVDSGGVDPLTGHHVIRKMLTGVAYDDTSSASYTYRTDNVPDTPPSTFKFDPLLESCNDKRYNGPMRQIAYEYQPLGPHGAITKEYKPNGPLVSKIDPPLPLHPVAGWLNQAYQETRGDGPIRTFTYTQFQIYTQNPQEPDPCLDVNNNVAAGRAPQQLLDHYTDFRGNITQLHYNTNWYIDKVTDANLNTTQYVRGNPPSQGGIGEIKTITHPAGVGYAASSIQYDYYPETNALGGHYLYHITDENQKMTTITRDPTRHWITSINYPQDANTPAAYETFTYNGFGQVLTHQMKNTAYESFVYDGRGLLTDKYNPKFGQPPGVNDPHTHYDYYTAGDNKPGWIDRVKKVTMPANWLGYVATETYQYDINPSYQPCPGPGLVTMVTHADNRYHSSTYDQWGNRRHEWNELGERTDYAYDGYNRVNSVTRANETTTYDYAPTQGDQTQTYEHTTNSPYWVTLPTAVQTQNLYDENWRKTSASVTGRTTWFHYDLVGNLDCVTDPRGSGPCDPHGSGPCAAPYTTTTQPDTRNRKWKVWDALGHLTTFTYDGVNNVTRIDRPDGSWETKAYDAVNRVWGDTVSYGGDPASLTTWFIYNPSGTLYQVTDPRGTTGRTYPTGDPNYTTTFLYDASDQKFRMTYPDNSYQGWAYDYAHNLYSRKTVNGEILYFGYDNRNRKYAETWADANAEWRYFELDAGSRLRRALNGTGAWWANQFADVHRNYNTAGRLTLDRQSIQTAPNVWGTVDVNYEYDPTLRGTDGKPTRISVPGVPGGGFDYALRYDDMGRFEKILRNGTTYPYFQYYYDNASNETQRRGYLSNTATVDQFYNPDDLGRIGKVELQRNGSAFNPQEFETYQYYPAGQLYSVTRGDNLQDQFGYYQDGELYWVMYGVSGAAGPDASATPPANDPTKEKTPEDFLSLGQQPNYTQTYQRAVTYVYDKAGNRLGTNDNGIATVYTPNNINQYQSISINNVDDPVTNGNEHQVGSYKNASYTYMRDEHLIGVTSGTNTYNLAYDALGRCVKRTLNTGQGNVTKYYIYDGERPILEYNASGTLVGYNLDGKEIDEILMRYDPTLGQNQTFYYQQDHEGSVTRLLNGNGDIIEKYRYDVFGNPLILSPTNQQRTASIVSNRFMFTGREFSNMFGFYEYRARAYNPLLGRFMSEDPKLFVRRAGLEKGPDDLSFSLRPDKAEYNLFRYCDNDPVDFTDPMGTDPVGAAIGQVIGGVLGGYMGTDIGAAAGGLTGFGAGIETGPGELVFVPAGAITGGVVGGGYGTIKGSEIGRTVGDRVGDAIKQAFGNRLNSTGAVPRPEDVRGKTPQEVRDMMREKGWKESASRRGDGTRFANPDKKGEQVRIQPGDRNDPNPAKQDPYVRISTQGQVSDPIPLKAGPDAPEIQPK